MLVTAPRQLAMSATSASNANIAPTSSAVDTLLFEDVDVGRRPVDRRVDLDPSESRGERLERALQAARDLFRVGLRELLDDEHQVGPNGITDQELVVLPHLRDVAESEGWPLDVLDRDPCEVLRRRRDRHVLDPNPLVRRLDDPARARGRALLERQRAHELGVGGRVDHLLERHAVRTQTLRIDEHLQLLVAKTEDRHVRDAGHPEESRTDRVARQDRHLVGLDLVRRQRDHHDPAGGRQRLEHLCRSRLHVGKRGLRL